MPKLIIVGLGNPGQAYDQTRHNTGFMVVDRLAQQLGLGWQNKSQWQAEIADGPDILLVKPQTYMNKSGDSVASIVHFYKLSLEQLSADLIVIHDDLDIVLGQYKKVLGKGPKQHNGITSLEQSLKTEQFIRYRVGIDNRQGDRQTPGDEYVLAVFRPEEKSILDSSIDQVVSELKTRIYAQDR